MSQEFRDYSELLIMTNLVFVLGCFIIMDFLLQDSIADTFADAISA